MAEAAITDARAVRTLAEPTLEGERDALGSV
jgi:hypothetical protein